MKSLLGCLLFVIVIAASVWYGTSVSAQTKPIEHGPWEQYQSKPHTFTVVNKSAGLIAMRDDGKTCKTADVVCVGFSGLTSKDREGADGVSCSLLINLPLCEGLE